MRVHSLLNAVQRALARSESGTTAAILLRNQSRQVILYRLGESKHFDANGEALFVRTVAPMSANVIDVGANIGEWTTRFLKARGDRPTQMIVFEPQSSCVSELRAAFADRSEIDVVHAGLDEKAGSLTLYEPGNRELATFVPPDVDVPTETAPTTTLDAEVRTRTWDSVDLLKIDAEGYDFRVIRGATNLLDEGRIRCLQFEYNIGWAAAGSTLAGAHAFLSERGYRTYLLRSDGLYKLRYRRYGEYFAYSNFVSVSHEAEDWVRSLMRGEI